MKLLLLHVVNIVAMREHGRKVHDVEFSRRRRLDPMPPFRRERMDIAPIRSSLDMTTMSCATPLAASRRMQKKLAAGNQPDFRTISDFRKEPLGALRGLFDQVLQIALQGDDELAAGSVGREQSESQRDQAQGGELWVSERVQSERLF